MGRPESRVPSLVTNGDAEPGTRNSEQTPVGVLLMSFGTAASLDDVPAYLANVRGGKAAPEDLIAEFQRRFARIGGSPLTRITQEQAAALELVLNKEPVHNPSALRSPKPPRGYSDQPPTREPRSGYIVRVGMRHAPPFIADGLRELAGAGARAVVAVILSPQYSDVIMGGYLRAVAAASEPLGGVDVAVAGAWQDVDAFLDGLALRLSSALDRLDPDERGQVPVLFTAHSLPRSVADGEPGYIQQLVDTASAVAARAGLSPERWRFAYQSAGHTREEWLTPDLKDLFPGLRADGHRTVVIAPVQFLADHLEILYDIDVAAREEAESVGMSLVRTEMLNCDPTLIRALAVVVARERRPLSPAVGREGDAR